MRMRRVTWPKVGGHKLPHIWNPRPHIAYSLCNFQGAAVTIKGSLLMNLPIIKRFGRKFSKSKNGSKNWCFLSVEKFWRWSWETPLGNQSSPNHVVWHKNGGDTPRNMFSRAWQEVTKKYKNKKKHLNVIFHPHAGAAPSGRFSQFLACGVIPPT